MVKCVSSAFLLHSTLLFLYCSKIVYVSAYLGIEVDMHKKKGGGGVYVSVVAERLMCISRWRQRGGCVCVRGRNGTDRCVRDTQNKTGGGEGGVCMCLKIYLCEEFACIVFLTRLTAQFVQSKGTVPRDIWFTAQCGQIKGTVSRDIWLTVSVGNLKGQYHEIFDFPT